MSRKQKHSSTPTGGVPRHIRRRPCQVFLSSEVTDVRRLRIRIVSHGVPWVHSVWLCSSLFFWVCFFTHPRGSTMYICLCVLFDWVTHDGCPLLSFPCHPSALARGMLLFIYSRIKKDEDRGVKNVTIKLWGVRKADEWWFYYSSINKRKESGKKCHVRNYDVQWAGKVLKIIHIMCRMKGRVDKSMGIIVYCYCLLWIDEAKANIKPIYECRCNERL
jgi:hypothetical protein